LGYIHSEFNDIRLQKKIRRVSRFVDIITEILIEMIIINAADDAPYVSLKRIAGAKRIARFLVIIYLFIYYMVYTHAKSFTIVKNRN